MPDRRGLYARVLARLRAHPLLVFLLLSPGIVEYLSGSSPLNAIVLNPAWFVIQLGLNAFLYLPGVLLIREAAVRWEKGWISILVLGAAYGILEEGVALSTLFNPSASVVQSLGIYGHWLGVNTVWLPGVLIVHMLWSIALPIFLFGLIYPELRERSLLSNRGVVTTLVALGADVAVLALAITLGTHFFMGWTLFFGSFVAIGLLIVLAYAVPGDLLARSGSRPLPGGLKVPVLAGIGLYLGILLVQGVAEYYDAPPSLAIAAVVSVALAEGAFAYRYLRGATVHRARLVYLLSTLLPVVVFGVVAQFPLDLVLVGDALLVLLFVTLWRQPRADASAGEPAGRASARAAA